jgi:hypothetical protein
MKSFRQNKSRGKIPAGDLVKQTLNIVQQMRGDSVQTSGYRIARKL